MSMEPSSSADDKDKTEPETALDDKRDMAPASDRPINDDDDDKTEPVPEQLTRTSSGEPDGKCDEDYANGEPADLSTKSQKEEEHPVERPFRLDPEDVARFSRDPAQWLKTFRVPAPDQQSREPEDKGRLKPVDYTTLNNNNIVHQLLGQQLLGNRNSLEENDVTSKKKRSRSKKRRSGSDVTDPSSGVVSISGGVVTPLGAAAAGLTPSAVDSNSPPVVLDVVCGQNQASLSLEKLKSGSKTACVLLNGSWLTPNQYQHVSGRGTARDWKRSIKHNGTSLKALLASKVLTFDPPSCRCNLCLAISSHAKENPGAIGVHPETRVDQENEPPRRGVDGSPSAIGDGDGGGAKSPSPLIIRTSKAPTPTIVCRSRDSVETEDYDEEEEDEEEEEEMDGEKEEEEEEDEEEEEEEDWEKKRSLMDALSLKELPTTTSRRLLCPADDDATKPCRKRKALALQEGGDGRRANKKKVKVKVPDGPTKEKRMKNGLGLVHLRKSSHGSEKVRRNSENDAVLCAAGSSSSVASDWTMLNTSGPSDLCRVLSASTGATSSLGTEAFKAMQQRTNGESTAPSLQKEETLTHIIHELRNYKKSLEEKIVASRRTSHVTPKEPTSASGVLQSSPHLGQWSPPTGKDGPSPMFQRRVSGCSDKAKNPDAARTSASQDGCGRKDWSVKSATKLDGSDEKQLPDLVRSHNPSTITTTTSSPAAGLSATTPRTTPCAMYSSFTPSPLTSTSHYNPIARYVIDPLTGAKYECDEHGVIDLSIGKKHPTSSNLARPIYSTLMGKMDLDYEADSDGERVLDLSVTSKVKAEHRTTTPKAATEEQRVPKRKRLSDGHSRQRGTAVQKRQSSSSSSSSWIGLSPGKILGWTETDVAKFVADVPECGIYAETFKQFRVTGPSLVCLSVDQMTAILRMRLNAAQSLRSAIDRIVAAAAATVTSA